jgi:hypothetical protein
MPGSVMAEIDQLVPRLSFQLTRADWLAFEQLPGEFIGWDKLYVFGPPVVCGAMIGLFADQLRDVLPIDWDSVGGRLLAGAAVLLVSWLLFAVLIHARNRRRAACRHVPASATTIDSTLDALTVDQDGTHQRYAWLTLHVIATDTHVFLCATPRDAIIIPRRAFESDAAMALFAHLATELGKQPDARATSA